MARTIAEIKDEMTTAFMAESAVVEKYGFTATDTFEGKFSKVSIEGLLFYGVAFGIWVLEKLFDTHKAEVEEAMAEQQAHTTRWYRSLVLGMVPTGMTEAPVKYCSVDDSCYRLKVKIAGGTEGSRTPVSAAVKAAVESYLAEEKDAGLKVEVVNEDLNRLKGSLRVWYDPMELTPGDEPVEEAVKAYVSSLAFDGLLTRNGIEDAARAVSGVKMVRTEALQTRYAENGWRTFGNQEVAESGYWGIEDGDLTVTYERWRRESL